MKNKTLKKIRLKIHHLFFKDFCYVLFCIGYGIAGGLLGPLSFIIWIFNNKSFKWTMLQTPCIIINSVLIYFFEYPEGKTWEE